MEHGKHVRAPVVTPVSPTLRAQMVTAWDLPNEGLIWDSRTPKKNVILVVVGILGWGVTATKMLHGLAFSKGLFFPFFCRVEIGKNNKVTHFVVALRLRITSLPLEFDNQTKTMFASKTRYLTKVTLCCGI